MVKLSKEDLARLKKNPKDKKFWGAVQASYDFKQGQEGYFSMLHDLETQFTEDSKHKNERRTRRG